MLEKKSKINPMRVKECLYEAMAQETNAQAMWEVFVHLMRVRYQHPFLKRRISMNWEGESRSWRRFLARTFDVFPEMRMKQVVFTVSLTQIRGTIEKESNDFETSAVVLSVFANENGKSKNLDWLDENPCKYPYVHLSDNIARAVESWIPLREKQAEGHGLLWKYFTWALATCLLIEALYDSELKNHETNKGLFLQLALRENYLEPIPIRNSVILAA